MILNGIERHRWPHPIRSAYEAVISLEARLAMVMAFIEADSSLNVEYLPHFSTLRTRILKLYKKRHEVAHFTVVARAKDSGFKSFIRPFFKWSDFILNKGPELDAQQLMERAQSFNALYMKIQKHIQHVGALRKLPLEYYARAGDISFPPLGPEDLNLLSPQLPQPPSLP